MRDTLLAEETDDDSNARSSTRGDGKDDFEQAYGISFEQFIDVASWKRGPDLPALYTELEEQVARAVEEEDGRRDHVRNVLFPQVPGGDRSVEDSGLHQFTPAMIERAHTGFLFNGSVEACDGTSAVHDALPITVTQIGVSLVSYNGPEGSYVHRLYRKDIQERPGDPAAQIAELLSRREKRGGVGFEDADFSSELSRRGLQAYIERAILVEESDAPWRMGHGNPTPYELLTGYWAHRPKMVKAGLSLMRELVERKRFVFIPSAPRHRGLLTLGYALNPLEYLVLFDVQRHLKEMVDRGNYRGEARTAVETFVADVGPQIVMGLYRVSDLAPPYLFYAHREYVHYAAMIAMADSTLQLHRGFPMLIDTADKLCAAEFGASDLNSSVQHAYARAGSPFRYLGERETRR
ncbi:MAG TPA: hypothetical protein VFQ39_03875 [Longimicrobium sp.]|nr:hypothetical protein [Longimicrobium sp.]